LIKFSKWCEERQGLGEVDPNSQQPVADYGNTDNSSKLQQALEDLISSSGSKLVKFINKGIHLGVLDSDPNFKNKLEELAKMIKVPEQKPRQPPRGVDTYDNTVVRHPADASGGAMGGNQGGGGDGG
jgi:hypothetical protein